MAVSKTDAVAGFKELFEDVSVSSSIDVGNEISKFVSFYKETRISGASIENDGDMLLVEWGVTTPHVMSKVTDFTEESAKRERVSFHPEKRRWIGLTRQIHESDIENSDFDGNTIGLCLFFFFGSSDDRKHSGNMWFDGLNDLDRLMGKCFEEPYLDSLKEEKPAITNAFISGIG